MGAGDHNEGRASLAARGIVRDFGDARVLDGVDLVRELPGIVGLVGANGSGKTTLLRIIAQVVAHEGGELVVAGRTVERGDDARARRLVGWVPHEALAWRDSGVAHNLRYAARLAGLDRRGAGAAADAAIERWDLGAYRDAAVRTLSRGWTQRYAFARADLLEPPVLLLDEPTNGLDVRARTALDEALDGWRSSRVVVVASHERAWLDERADEVVDLGAGRA